MASLSAGIFFTSSLRLCILSLVSSRSESNKCKSIWEEDEGLREVPQITQTCIQAVDFWLQSEDLTGFLCICVRRLNAGRCPGQQWTAVPYQLLNPHQPDFFSPLWKSAGQRIKSLKKASLLRSLHCGQVVDEGSCRRSWKIFHFRIIVRHELVNRSR